MMEPFTPAVLMFANGAGVVVGRGEVETVGPHGSASNIVAPMGFMAFKSLATT